MPERIVSVCGRAGNGSSRPFLCEAEDGHLYYVKRDNLPRGALVIEYLMSRLAEECGLPVAPFELVEIPAELARFALVADAATEFRPGIAFGSRLVPFGDEIRPPHLRLVDATARLRCLCFDWWTCNPDRRLDRLSGDPNAIWDPLRERVFFIDQDSCFDPGFDPAEFKARHLFRDSRAFLERAFLEKFRIRFESAVYKLDKIWEEMPGEWRGEGGDAPPPFTRQEIEARLIKPEHPVEGILPG